ncbi:MAG: aldo/keto reductase [Celeribacter sp.]|jgi:aryl-alcohol dehydrogenase-like predicted oxidoreductase
MSMTKRQLGANGPEVSAIGLGCMSFAGFFGPTDEATSQDCLAAAVEHGIDFWDTSNVYGMGLSEQVIGRFLKGCDARITLATKVGIMRGPPRRFDNTEDYIRSELEGSLTRLGRDHVELYYIHRRDPDTPVEQVAETMGKLIEEGLIGGWGLSEIAPATLRQAHRVVPVRAVQNEYSLWSRQPELGLIRACEELGVAFVPFSPLARGMLGERPLDRSAFGETDFRRANPRFTEPNLSHNLAAIAGFRAFAQGRGWTVSAAALAWVLDRSPAAIPIPGTRSRAHLEEWLDATAIRFTDDDRAEIDRLLPPGFAHGDRYSYEQLVGVERYC